MRRLFLIAALFFAAHCAHAATCPISSGSSQSTIQGILNSCGSGNTAVFAAGTYTGLNNLSIPCGVSMTGPVVPYQQTHYQTAILQGASGVSQGFHYGNCSTAVTFQYLEWNGEQSSNTGGDAGGFITIQGTTSNVTIQYMWIHGMSGCNNDASHGCGGTQSNGINIGGGGGGSTTTNTVIQLNEFGSETLADCAAAMNDTQTAVGGGNCNGVGVYGSTANVSVIYNIAHYLEQGFKYYEVSGYGTAYCNPFTLSYNSITQVNRIAYETQCNIGTSSFPTLMYVQYNYLGNRCSQSGCTNDTLFDLSDANGCGPGAGTLCVTHTDYNVDVQDLSSNNGAGLEIWGQQGTTGSYNLLQGYVAHGGCSAFCWDTNGAFTFANNIINVYNGSYFQNGGNPHAYNPTITGNTTNTTPSALTSVQPTISPAAGSHSYPLTVTFSNSGANRDTNTGVWYTTDGSSPTPGSGTAKFLAPNTSFVLASAATVKAVGMWGAINQPTSYPSGYGYVPSAVLSTTYTGGGTPTANTPTFSPVAGTYMGTQSVAISTTSAGAIICWNTTGSPATNGSTGCSTGSLYAGAVSVAASETLYAVAGGTGYTDSTVGSAAYVITSPSGASTPTFSPVAGTYVGTQSVTLSSTSPGAIVCWNTTGGPATNGTSGCSTGSLYTGAISVAFSETLFAVAGGTGYTDSSIGSAAYVITSPSGANGFISGVTQFSVGVQ